MATADARSNRNKFIILGIVILVIALVALLSIQQSPKPSNSTPSASSQNTSIPPYYNGTKQNQSITTIVQQYGNVSSYAAPGTVYCVGGQNDTQVINSSYSMRIYNSSQNTTSAAPWSSNPDYPIPVEYPSCVQDGGYAYCIGGMNIYGNATSYNSTYANATVSDTDEVFSAELHSSTTSNWTRTSSYPQQVDDASCVAYNNYVYCTGGEDQSNPVSSSYYARLNGPQVGQWQSTTPYPQKVLFKSCVASNGYIYCMGGSKLVYSSNGSTIGINSTHLVYYAPLSASGIGGWSATMAYPTNVTSPLCVQYAGYVYCVGNNIEIQQPNLTYYAPISASGVGQWSNTTEYPSSLQPSDCVANQNDLYCIGSSDAFGNSYESVYYANLSASGTSTWTQYPYYPTPIEAESCVAT